MLRHGYEPRMGLGKDSHGNADVVDIRGNPHKYGLGYEPGKPGRRNAPSRLRVDRAWPAHVCQCFTSAGIMFVEEENQKEGRGHNKALDVSIKCMDRVDAKVLIDNGSSLDVTH